MIIDLYDRLTNRRPNQRALELRRLSQADRVPRSLRYQEAAPAPTVTGSWVILAPVVEHRS